MSDYWPWWAGALALGAIPVVYSLLADRPLGISGAWDRVLHWRSERERERLDAVWAGNEAALAAAIAAAGPAPAGPAPGQGASVPDASAPAASAPAASVPAASAPAASAPAAAVPSRPVPVLFQAVLLLSVFAGGVLAAVTSGRFKVRTDMGGDFAGLVTGNRLGMAATLFAGGVLVGFGTRLAGGCTSGHGLSGISRLQRVSVLATAVFFGTAVAVSFLLWRVL